MQIGDVIPMTKPLFLDLARRGLILRLSNEYFYYDPVCDQHPYTYPDDDELYHEVPHYVVSSHNPLIHQDTNPQLISGFWGRFDGSRDFTVVRPPLILLRPRQVS